MVAELYPQSGGVEVDGVVRIDPTGLARLLRLTGPVEVDGLPYPLDATNVEAFLEVEQYRLFDVAEERSDLLGQVGARVFEVLSRLVARPVLSSNTSASALFRRWCQTSRSRSMIAFSTSPAGARVNCGSMTFLIPSTRFIARP